MKSCRAQLYVLLPLIVAERPLSKLRFSGKDFLANSLKPLLLSLAWLETKKVINESFVPIPRDMILTVACQAY